MRISVISDARLPTSWGYAGHGLGKSMLLLAEGLAERGHEVVLVAGPGSVFEGGELITVVNETDLAREAFGAEPDVVLDGSHEKMFQRWYPECPVVNRSADREMYPGWNAVYPSKAHAEAYGVADGRVIYSAVDERMFVMPEMPEDAEDYLLWLGPVNVSHKRVDLAVMAARMAGVRLIIAGTGRMWHEGFIGPVSGAQKLWLLQGALAVLVTGEIEAGPLTCLEAACCGTPVIGLDRGGTPEYIGEGESGFVCADVEEMARAVQCVGFLSPQCVRDWALRERGRERMLAEYEAELEQVCAQEMAEDGHDGRGEYGCRGSVRVAAVGVDDSGGVVEGEG